jgi:beta-glucosidase
MLALAASVAASDAGHAAASRGAVSSLSAEKRAENLVRRMTLEEKIASLHGLGTREHQRYVPGVPRLRIPPLVVTNGPAGISAGDDPVQRPATALPAPIALAASWDRGLARRYGSAIGDEARSLGAGLVEGPDLDIARVPEHGRTFEAFGEDPYLTGQMGANEVAGIQSRGVIAQAKHFVGNNQETNRLTVNAVVAPRVLREIYLPPYEAAIKGGRVASVMCAYNRVNGVHSCEDRWLLRDVLRRDFGFGGFVMSDFGATHSTAASVRAGLDLEMPRGQFYAAALRDAVRARQISVAAIDRLIARRFTAMIRFGLMQPNRTAKPIPVKAHGAFARAAAERGIVLLKNAQRELPLDPRRIRTIAVIGEYGVGAHTGGRGSSRVNPLYTVNPVEAIARRAGRGVRVSYAYAKGAAGITPAVQLARSADVAIVMVGDSRTEAEDRTTLALPDAQDDLVRAIARVNTRTIVVVKSGGPVLMPWLSQVPAVLEAWYPGQEDGNAVAAILFGDVNPSGKLPLTFPRTEAQSPVHATSRFPGINGAARYSEGLLVGYRWYDKTKAAPLFPFGFGLSYTTFSYRRIDVVRRDAPQPAARVSVVVTNTGTRAGAEVAQLYVAGPAGSLEPAKQLRGFRKVLLRPGRSTRVTFDLDRRAFSTWNEDQRKWTVRPGFYRLLVGASSRDLRQQGTLRVG